jgi:hypothetical protein
MHRTSSNASMNTASNNVKVETTTNSENEKRQPPFKKLKDAGFSLDLKLIDNDKKLTPKELIMQKRISNANSGVTSQAITPKFQNKNN